MIPKRIILTHISESLLSPLQDKCIKRMRAFHPSWEIKFYGHQQRDRFVRESYPELFEMHEWFPRHVQRADFFRVLELLKNGGFYLDTDIWLHEPLDPLCAGSAVFANEWTMDPETFQRRHRAPPEDPRELKQLANYAFGAEPGHPFLAEMLEEMIRRTCVIDRSRLANDDVLYSTGPDLTSSVFYRNFEAFKDCVLILEGQQQPPEPKPPIDGDPTWQQFGKYGNHLLAGSWRR